jgi:two-component sensor histidine kinase
MRRVATISLVHESLSQNLDEQVELDDMLKRALRLAADVASTRTRVRTEQSGSFGMVPAQDATPLALVLTELVTNAVEHAFPDRESGTVTIDVGRDGDSLRIVVADDGEGMPDGIEQLGRSSSSGLGSQIVRTLVTNELRGSIDWRPRDGGGTEVVVELDLRSDAHR